MDFKASEKDYLKYKLRTLEFKVEQMQKTLHDEDVIAKIHNGKIRGSKRLTIYNDVYYSFEAIPYALPPLGELRFRAPKPMTGWKHIRDCSWYGPKAMQRNLMQPDDIEGSENCLFLNVYTNNLKPTKPRPVMVWIHGGGFFFGEANREWYGPDYFMKKDVILITVQYRLGALGFLSFKDPSLHVPGNAGLKDVVLALKWIKKNVACFGGNPECVTVFGESAGAVIVHFLTLSEQARGLFHRAIIQSGAATADWSTASNIGYDLALNAGYKGVNKESQIYKYLLTLTAEEILEAENKCRPNKDGQLFAFAPIVEPYLTLHTVLAKPIDELLPATWSNAIPIMLGATSMEGLFFERTVKGMEDLIMQSLETCEFFVPINARPSIDSPEVEVMQKGRRLQKIHVKAKQPTIQDYYDILAFSLFWHPLQKAIDARLKYARKAPTYLYRFDFDTKKVINPFRLLRDSDCGVTHTDELSFLFSSTLAKPMERQSREYQCLKRMISLWTQFAETGNPNGAKIPNAGIKWHSLRRRTEKDNNNVVGELAFKCLNISDELTFIDLPEMEKLKVWKSLYGTHSGTISTATSSPVVYAKSLL